MSFRQALPFMLVAFLTLATTILAQTPPVSMVIRAKAATAILVAQDEAGGMRVRCTATAFKKDGKKVEFVSAAHCVGEDNVDKERVAEFANQSFYITFDESDVKVYYAAKPLAVGYQHAGDDFSVFEVDTSKTTKTEWETVPLGDEGKEAEGNPVINVAAPLGLGLQVFKGSISSLKLDRPIVEGDINWRGVMLLQMPGTDGGSSGSSVVSLEQNAIVGFVVGTISGSQVTAVPVSKFKKFLDLIKDGTYRFTSKTGV